MAYTDVISLSEAKNYLRIDENMNEDDQSIIRMINSSLSFIEKWTNQIVDARDKTYRLIDGCIRVYDYPINTLVDPVDATSEIFTLYSNYSFGSENSEMVLNVGYTDPLNIPPELIEVAYEVIDLMYYEHETGKSFRKDLSALSVDLLNQNRRFVF